MASSKLSARAVHGQFVCTESEETSFCLYEPIQENVIHTRAQDLWPCKNEQLPTVFSLPEGIARQTISESKLASNGQSQDVLVQAFKANIILLRVILNLLHATKFKSDTGMPRSFRGTIQDKLWCKAIDRDPVALPKSQLWGSDIQTSHQFRSSGYLV